MAGVSFSRWELGVSSSSSSSRMHTRYGRSAVLVPSETRDLVTISILDGGEGLLCQSTAKPVTMAGKTN